MVVRGFSTTRPTDRLVTLCSRVLRLSVLVYCTSRVLAADPASVGAMPLRYPDAPRGDVVDDYNGIKVADPYRWLEELNSEETRKWVLAEAQLTDSYLDNISQRSTVKARLSKLLDFEKYGTPFHRAGRAF